MRHVIIGDGVAGHNAADTIREEDSDAEIHVFTDESLPFYDRIGLRDYIRGGRDRSDLVLNGADWYRDRGIELHRSTTVTSLDRSSNTVHTSDGGEYGYDQLLIATGSRPRTLEMEQEVDKTHHLWDLDSHGKPLREDLRRSEEGVVIGGGLLGFDLIGSFNEVVDATYLIREDRWWHSVLTQEGADIVHTAMRDSGVDLRLEEEAVDMEEVDGGVSVVTDRATYVTGVVGVAVGNVRNTGLAEEAGLDTGSGIICDETLQTADPDVYTAGDVAEYFDPVLGRHNLGGSWITAQEQGEIAGTNMAGGDASVDFVDTYTVNHFGLNIASIGDPSHAEGCDVITAIDRESDVYRKVVIEDDRIIGAALIGEMKWMHPLKQIIKQKVDVTAFREEFRSAGFDPEEVLK